jgi:ABC-type glycerol-3-phosphate transport system substrate-binding protein
MKRILALLLVLLLMIPAAACANNGSGTPADTSSADSVTVPAEDTSDSLDARKNISDNLSESDFGGADFLILFQDTYEYDAGIEELTGEVLDDAVYNRNARIDERFNINIKVENGGNSSAMSAKINKTVKAGDDAYDLCMAHIIQTGTDITNGLFYNWMDIGDVDTAKPWYPQYAVGPSTVNGKLYALVSDAALSSVNQTYCVYFNKNIASDYNIVPEDIYSAVRDGSWTIDKMSEYIKPVYQDLNGNGKKDEADLYGNKTLLF